MKNFTHILALFGMLLLAGSACDHIGPATKGIAVKPENLIPTDTMISILMEMHVNEAMILNEQTIGRDVNPLIKGGYQDIYEKYSVDSVRLRESLRYYVYDIDMIGAMYETIIADLSYYQSSNMAAKNPVEEESIDE